MPANARRIVLTIAGGKVTEQLTDFPVYVDLIQDDLKTRFNPAQLSFKQRMGGNVQNLPYELQSFDKSAGRLRAWVLLPELSYTADNVFELQYGDGSVAAAANAPEVWRNHYKVVFHLESATAPIADSRQASPGTPANLQTNASITARLGKGIDFDGNINGWVSFTNPISGNSPSTISVWVNQDTATNKDALVVLGGGNTGEGRWLNGQFNNDEVGLGLLNDDWTSTGLDVEGEGWRLLHWTYNNKVSRLYQDGVIVDTPFTHASNANTQGTAGWLGNNKSTGFDNNSGLNGTLDEVRVADIDRTPGWIAAEFTNQADPAEFVAASGPQPLP